MRIAVIGASGRTGREVVRQALGHGDEVVALSREPDQVGITHTRLHVTAGGAHDLASLRIVVAQAEAVVSVFGDHGHHTPQFYESGIANVLQAMAEAEVPRLVAASLAGAFVRGDRNLPLGLKLRLATSGELRGCYDDLAAMERRIMASAMDWTILRPVRLIDGSLTGRYRTGLDGTTLRRGRDISRPDLAALALKSLSSDLYTHRAVAVAY